MNSDCDDYIPESDSLFEVAKVRHYRPAKPAVPIAADDGGDPDPFNDPAEVKAQIAQRQEQAAAVRPSEDAEPPGPALFAPSPMRSEPWPVLDKAAMHGPMGALVRAIEPHTEADPVAILLQTLVGFGNIVGRQVYYAHEADRHYGNEFLVVVGPTATGRKGTSWGWARRALGVADTSWASERIVRGLSSGEGLIHEVRDAGKDDAGASDKRLMVQESEFASVLKVIDRQGNTLSPVLRQAWEGGQLRTLVKTSPAKCDAPHISMIGHITSEELRRCLTATEVANGLGNRHLFACVRRSKMLPDGGTPDEKLVEACGQEIGYAAAFAKNGFVMTRSEDARELWHEQYPRLSADRPGLVGAMSARCLAHVCRLSMMYALLDRQPVIGVQHLRAGIACWDYCEASLRFVFGDTLGDPTADEIRTQLREATNGLSRTELRDLFGRNKKTGEIDNALTVLQRWNMAEPRAVKTPGKPGRPGERWFSLEA
ncbi:DUF3987 domain-containing protein [Gemmata sp.]|uniref:DUF3987 domain-containing protein n=1 Tax=Gemmata sp. TaxID=1914242 RepID=UPI003F6EF474